MSIEPVPLQIDDKASKDVMWIEGVIDHASEMKIFQPNHLTYLVLTYHTPPGIGSRSGGEGEANFRLLLRTCTFASAERGRLKLCIYR